MKYRTSMRSRAFSAFALLCGRNRMHCMKNCGWNRGRGMRMLAGTKVRTSNLKRMVAGFLVVGVGRQETSSAACAFVVAWFSFRSWLGHRDGVGPARDWQA